MGFWADDVGAVTVDWVVLTAAVAGLGLASVAAVRSGVGALGQDIETSLSQAEMLPNWMWDTELVAQSTTNVRSYISVFSDNRLRMHYYWWENERTAGRFSNDVIDMHQTVGLQILAERGIELEAPPGASVCDNLASHICWNDI